jgi:acyl-CoA thioester hydrolase
VDESSRNEPFVWPVRVYYEDTDAQGRVYFANYFKFMERARTEWLRDLGVEQDVLLSEARRFFVVVDTQADFLQPANFNDELSVTVRLLKVSRASFLIEQEIYRSNAKNELLCRGTTRAAYLSADTYKPVSVPAAIFEDSEK